MKAIKLVVYTRQGTRLAGTTDAVTDEMRMGVLQLLSNLKAVASLSLTDDKGVTRYIHPDAIEHIELHEREARPDEAEAAQKTWDAVKARQRLTVPQTIVPPNGGHTPSRRN